MVTSLLVTPQQAHAQATTFVSNIGQDDSTDVFNVNNVNRVAQRFTTGPNRTGYTLSEIVVNLRNGNASATPEFTLYTLGSISRPGTKIEDLNGSVATAGEQSFTPANPVTLNPNTSYFIILETTGSDSIQPQLTDSDDIDTGASSGWDVFVTHLRRTSGTGWVIDSPSIEIAVKGTANPLSNDATLSGLTLADAADNSFDLIWTRPSPPPPRVTPPR